VWITKNVFLFVIAIHWSDNQQINFTFEDVADLYNNLNFLSARDITQNMASGN